MKREGQFPFHSYLWFQEVFFHWWFSISRAWVCLRVSVSVPWHRAWTEQLSTYGEQWVDFLKGWCLRNDKAVARAGTISQATHKGRRTKVRGGVVIPPLLDPCDDNSGLIIQPQRTSSLLSLSPSTHEALSLMSAWGTAILEWEEHEFQIWVCGLLLFRTGFDLQKISGHGWVRS